MKRYTVTEKQLEQLKKLLEQLESTPVKMADEDNGMTVAEGGEPIDGLGDLLSNAIAETLRNLKFLVEDIEGQE